VDIRLRNQFDFTLYTGIFMNKTVLYIIAGASLGILGPVLVYFGNPANMGVCAACFLRDSVGALGFHQAKVVQYLRPEILGLIIGGFLASVLWSRNFTPVSGSTAFSRFFLGVFAMIGCLIFLGCPWRAFLRLGGGDMTAIAGLVGLFAGVFVGRFFKKNGYVIPENDATTKPVAFLPLIIAILLLIALVFGLKLGDNGALFSSEKGPGSQHANIFISLCASSYLLYFAPLLNLWERTRCSSPKARIIPHCQMNIYDPLIVIIRLDISCYNNLFYRSHYEYASESLQRFRKNSLSVNKKVYWQFRFFTYKIVSVFL